MIVTSASAPSRSVPFVQLHDLAPGCVRHQLDQLHPGDVPRLDQRLDVQRQRAFQADDAERGVRELQFLLLGQVRRVVGGEESIVPSFTPSMHASTSAAVRSGGFILKFVSYAAAGFVRQQQVVRRDLGRHASARRCFARRISSTLQAVLMCCT